MRAESLPSVTPLRAPWILPAVLLMKLSTRSLCSRSSGGDDEARGLDH
jgi:hypothetical protein